MAVLLVLGYIAWFVITGFICAYIIGFAMLASMDTQSLPTWFVCIALALMVGTGSVMLFVHLVSM